MGFLNKLKTKATELAEQAQDRFKAEGGLEGIIQKTTAKVDKMAESASDGITKAASETKAYFNEAKDKAKENGDGGYISVAKTLGVKLGGDISELAQKGYQRIANSQTIQDLKSELKASEENTAKSAEVDEIDISTVTLVNVMEDFFAGTKKGSEWTTATQENNPKSERLSRVTYVINGNEWFNLQTREGGNGAFDLTIDYLVTHTQADLNNAEIAKTLTSKAYTMLREYVRVNSAPNEKSAEPSTVATNPVATPVSANKVSSVNSVSASEQKIAKPAVKRAPAVKKASVTPSSPAVKNTNARKATATKEVPAKSAESKAKVSKVAVTGEAQAKVPAVKKAPVKKTVAAKTPNSPKNED